MDYISLISLIITIIALIITVISYFSNKKLKSSIISEKNMILDKISDIKTTLQGYTNKIYNDRKTQNDDSLNTLEKVRIEDFESIIKNLERFEKRLNKIK